MRPVQAIIRSQRRPGRRCKERPHSKLKASETSNAADEAAEPLAEASSNNAAPDADSNSEDGAPRGDPVVDGNDGRAESQYPQR